LVLLKELRADLKEVNIENKSLNAKVEIAENIIQNVKDQSNQLNECTTNLNAYKVRMKLFFSKLDNLANTAVIFRRKEYKQDILKHIQTWKNAEIKLQEKKDWIKEHEQKVS